MRYGHTPKAGNEIKYCFISITYARNKFDSDKIKKAVAIVKKDIKVSLHPCEFDAICALAFT